MGRLTLLLSCYRWWWCSVFKGKCVRSLMYLCCKNSTISCSIYFTLFKINYTWEFESRNYVSGSLSTWPRNNFVFCIQSHQATRYTIHTIPSCSLANSKTICDASGNRLKKSNINIYFLKRVQSMLTYRTETWAMKAENQTVNLHRLLILERAEHMMVRWMCVERKRSEDMWRGLIFKKK